MRVPGGRRRRPRARARLEARPQNLASTTVVCAPGQRRHRAPSRRRVDVDAGDPRAVLATSPNASASISPSSARSCRSIAASSICSRRAGRRIFGPSRAAAQLECSKVFAKDFMARHGIPTARYRVCDDAAEAHAVVASRRARLSGRRQGRRPRRRQGRRRRARSRRRRMRAIRAAMEERQFGDAGARVVLEECLDRSRGVVLRALRRHARRCR